MANTQVPDTPLPGAPWGVDRLGERIERMLRRAAISVLNATKSTLAHVLSLAGEVFLEALEQAAAPRIAPLIDAALESDDLPDFFRDYLLSLRNPSAQADALGLGGLAQGAAGGASSALLAPVFRVINYAMDRKVRSARFDPSTVMQIAWREGRDWDWVDWAASDTGWSLDQMKQLDTLMHRRLDETSLIAWMYRTGADEATVRTELNRRGWAPDDIDQLMEISRGMPGPNDMVRFAVREAYSPGQVQALSLDAEFPPVFGEQMEKLGFTAETARLFWRAHWELPSVQMGFEMFHRGELSGPELDSLLKALDIAPVWRSKLRAISYSVPTRVDVRRAYKEGVIGIERVKRVYQDLGYNEEWAQILTDWTAVAYEPEEQEATKGELLAALERGTLTESEVRQSLAALDYSTDMIEFYLAQVRYKRAQAVKKIKVDAVQDLYESGQIEQLEARTRLTAMALPSSEIDASIELWSIARELKTKKPTATQAKGFYLSDIIDAAQYRQMLDAAGYGDEYIALYVRAADAEKESAAAKETERAQKEEERLSKAEKVTDYQRTVAGIDVELAQERQAIAAAQAALNATMSTAEITAAQVQIEQLNAEIAAVQAAARVVHQERTEAQNQLRFRISDVDRQALEGKIDEARQEIAGISAEIAGLNVDIEERQLALLRVADEEEEARLDTEIQEIKVHIAQLREQSEGHDVAIAEANADLRAYITDAERQDLEARIRVADASIARHDVEVAEYQRQQAVLKAQIVATLNDDQRGQLADAIDAAKLRIAALQVARAQARVTEVA